jgi:hypothetical protein
MMFAAARAAQFTAYVRAGAAPCIAAEAKDKELAAA